ncbi:MAG: homocysteine S-methyltransferase family protein [Deltaproteobacteria bacterium]|nr:homocysteine S-methyltransferase family protein [Deltaproteobacteria bacterium]
MAPNYTVLDGPVGTELLRRGIPTPLPLWSATAIDEAPDVLAEIHRDYALAGATVHSTNTFRTSPWALRAVGREADAPRLTRDAVRIARSAVPSTHRVAGCLAPLEDCYSPGLSPAASIARPALGEAADLLAAAGVDLILCETFPHPGEALLALDAAAATGLPVWVSLTPGPSGDLLDDATILRVGMRAMNAGADAVLVNCGRPDRIATAIAALAKEGVPTGGYGNVGEPDPVQGWRSEGESAPDPYADAVLGWVRSGASIVGGCCGTTPAHIARINQRLRGSLAP